MKTPQEIRKIAEEHVDWYLSALRPQLDDHFIHGYKHCLEDKK